jgi:hypothetical protein
MSCRMPEGQAYCFVGPSLRYNVCALLTPTIALYMPARGDPPPPSAGMVQDLMEQCLHPNPQQRPTFEQVLALLSAQIQVGST